MPFSTVKIAWTYDALNRLRIEQRDEGDDGIQNGGDYTDTFAFDLAGNRIRRIHDAVGTGQDETVLSTYDGRDRLVGLNTNGNLNTFGRDILTDAGDVTFAYDLAGVRIRCSRRPLGCMGRAGRSRRPPASSHPIRFLENIPEHNPNSAVYYG